MAPYNKAPESGTRNGQSAGRGAGAGALVGGALFVGLIIVCALVLSYHGIFQLAVYGGHSDGQESTPLAHVFPVTYTLLLLMAFWVSFVLREAAPRERLWVDAGLIPILLIAAGIAMVLYNIGLLDLETRRFHEGIANVIVAVAPLMALLVAFLLWITVRAHFRRRNRAVSRPTPSADRTTVLHGRPRPATDPEEPDPDRTDSGDSELTTRLLDLGSHEDRNERPDLPEQTSEEQPEAVPEKTEDPAEEPEAPSEEHGSGPAGSAEGAVEEETEDPVPAEPLPTQGRGEPDPVAEQPSEPTVPLPRRSRAGDNPIKRAAESPPLVPGAAAPVDPATEPVPDPGMEQVTDEGFEHEPPPGDPATDEAEAPVETVDAEPQVSEAAEEPESEPEPSEAAREPSPEPEPEPEVEPEPEAEPEPRMAPETATETVEADTSFLSETDAQTDTNPPSAHWEPPSEHTGSDVLTDYVPPVWAPPEEKGAATGRRGEEEEKEDTGQEQETAAAPEETPALDHDTGPDVRAAFRRSGDWTTAQDAPAELGEAQEPDEPAELGEAQGFEEPDRKSVV